MCFGDIYPPERMNKRNNELVLSGFDYVNGQLKKAAKPPAYIVYSVKIESKIEWGCLYIYTIQYIK